jgi:hypothetical protein
MAVLDPLTIHDLMVADFETECLTPEINDWWNKASLPYAASCARQIWFGDVQAFKTFPVPEGQECNIKFLRTHEAYANLLAVLSGYESKRIGEQHIRGQFAQGWSQYTQEHPDGAQRMQKLVGQLKTDAAFIHTHISSCFQERCEAQAARDLSGQKKGDYIAIFAGKGRHGGLTPLTERMIRVSENLQKKNDDFITVVSPTDADFSATSAEIDLWRSQHKIRTKIDVVRTSALPIAISEAKHVYVLTPMGESIKTDKMIVDAWQKYAVADGHLVHLRGDPSLRGTSDQFWGGQEIRQYISPESVQGELKHRDEVNERVIANAQEAFTVCAQARCKGLLPSKVIQAEHPELLIAV